MGIINWLHTGVLCHDTDSELGSQRTGKQCPGSQWLLSATACTDLDKSAFNSSAFETQYAQGLVIWGFLLRLLKPCIYAQVSTGFLNLRGKKSFPKTTAIPLTLSKQSSSDLPALICFES